VGENKVTRDSDASYIVTGYTLTRRDEEHTTAKKRNGPVNSLKKKGQGTLMANTRMRQITGIVLLAAGLGWVGANFTPSDATWWNYLLHTIPFLLLLVLSLGFFHATDASHRRQSKSGWANVCLNFFAGFTFIALTVGMILGATNSDPNAYGIKTLADFVPSIIIMLGGLVWLTTLIPSHRGNAEASTASNA
jgi:hypothetical protein